MVAVAAAQPSPFTVATHVSYSLPRVASVTITIYDVLGRAVTTLVQGKQSSGLHTVTWDGTDRVGPPGPPGLYFLHLTVGNHTLTRKLTRLR